MANFLDQSTQAIATIVVFLASNAITHHVDVSWNQSWTDTDQKRVARFEGNRVYLSTPPSLDPITGTTSVRTMTWEKLG